MNAQVLNAGDTTFYEFDNRIGFWGRKNFSREVSYPGRSGEKIFVSHNSLGNRDEEVIKDDKQKTVVFLGGSHTWGYGVNQDARFTDRIRQQLESNVYNFGHCSLGLDQIALSLISKCCDLQPDVVVIEQYPWALHRVMAHQVNGFVRPKFYINQDGQLIRTPIPKIARYGAYRAVYKAYVTYRKEFFEYLEGINVEVNYDSRIDPIYLKWNSGFYEPMYELKEALINVISDYCRETDIELLFVIGTVREKLLFESTSRLVDYDLPRKKLVGILQKLGIKYIDSTEEMVKRQREGANLIFDDGHINASGHLAFSDMIFAELEKLGVG